MVGGVKAYYAVLLALVLGVSAFEVTAAKPITKLPVGLAMAKAQEKPAFIYVFDSI